MEDLESKKIRTWATYTSPYVSGSASVESPTPRNVLLGKMPCRWSMMKTLQKSITLSF